MRELRSSPPARNHGSPTFSSIIILSGKNVAFKVAYVCRFFVDAFSQCYKSGSELILVGLPMRIRIQEDRSDP
jgi:hypothetical protein